MTKKAKSSTSKRTTSPERAERHEDAPETTDDPLQELADDAREESAAEQASALHEPVGSTAEADHHHHSGSYERPLKDWGELRKWLGH